MNRITGNQQGVNTECRGPIRIVSSEKGRSKVSSGDIVYLQNAGETADDIVAFHQLIKAGAVGFICESIGRTDHRVIVAKEFGLPFITTISECELPEEGTPVTLRESHLLYGKKKRSDTPAKLSGSLSPTETNTDVLISLGFPELIRKRERLPKMTDGVGYLRTEFVLLDILDGIHPYEYIQRHNENILANKLANRIEPVFEAYSSDVWIRTDDFSVKQLHSMEEGNTHEAPEENSILGWRGVSRSVSEQTLYEIQLKAIQILVNRGYDNIGLFPPMTRFPKEYRTWKKQATDFGLTDIRYGLMVETPSAALTFEELTDQISFGVVGCNDLTQYTLAISRSNDRLQEQYSPQRRAVRRLIDRVLNIADQNTIEMAIGGQVGSNPDAIAPMLTRYEPSVITTPWPQTIVNVQNRLSVLEDQQPTEMNVPRYS